MNEKSSVLILHTENAALQLQHSQLAISEENKHDTDVGGNIMKLESIEPDVIEQIVCM